MFVNYMTLTRVGVIRTGVIEHSTDEHAAAVAHVPGATDATLVRSDFGSFRAWFVRSGQINLPGTCLWRASRNFTARRAGLPDSLPTLNLANAVFGVLATTWTNETPVDEERDALRLLAGTAVRNALQSRLSGLRDLLPVGDLPRTRQVDQFAARIAELTDEVLATNGSDGSIASPLFEAMSYMSLELRTEAGIHARH